MDSIDLADSLIVTADVRVDSMSTPTDATLVVQRIADIPVKSLDWIWPGWIPAGMITILGGHVGNGKSTVIAAIVAALTAAKPLPDGFTPSPANVLILSAEDDPARVIRPRLDANGADPARVFIMNGADGANGIPRRTIDLRHDAAHLRQLIDDYDIGLLVIDPLSSVFRRADRASEGAVRDALQPLLSVISSTGVAAIAVMRVGKTAHGHNPAQRLVGSSAVPAIARSVIMVATDDDADEPGRAILQVVKSNYTRAPQPVALQMADNGTVHWLGPVDTGIDELAGDRRHTKSERADAADFLREYLREKSVNAVSVLKQAKALGFSEITIRRAKKDLGIVSYRDAVLTGWWMWRLPEPGPESKTTRRRSRKKAQ